MPTVGTLRRADFAGEGHGMMRAWLAATACVIELHVLSKRLSLGAAHEPGIALLP